MIGSVVLLLTAVACAQTSEPPITTVGMSGQFERFVLPGTLLEVKPVTDRGSPVVVRIAAAYPHGDAYRYDLEYYALEPGTHDLRDYLQREDGSSLESIPSILVEVRSVLPAGQVQPNALARERLPSTGGYRLWLIIGGVFWGIGLFVILLMGRHRKRVAAALAAHATTFDDRLQVAIQAARAGELDGAERAELERMVLAYWRRRLSLEDVEASEAMAVMRQNEEAHAALQYLERWLHDPQGQIPDDFRQLVAPASDAPTTEQT